MGRRSAQQTDFLLGYARTTLQRACTRTKRLQNRAKGQAKAEALTLDVWLNRTGSWEQLPADVVQGLWGVKRSQADKSLCGLLLKDIFQLNAEQYKDVRKSLETAKLPGPNGIIYRATDRTNAYAIVVKLPNEVASNPQIQSAAVGALAALALSGAAGFAHHKGLFRKTTDRVADRVADRVFDVDDELQGTSLNKVAERATARLRVVEVENQSLRVALDETKQALEKQVQLCAEIRKELTRQRQVSGRANELLQFAVTTNHRLESRIKEVIKALEEGRDEVKRAETDLAQARSELAQSRAQMSDLRQQLALLAQTSREDQDQTKTCRERMEADLARERQELARSRAQVSDLQRQLATLEQTSSELQAESRTLQDRMEADLAQARTRVSEFEGALGVAERTVRELQASKSELEPKMESDLVAFRRELDKGRQRVLAAAPRKEQLTSFDSQKRGTRGEDDEKEEEGEEGEEDHGPELENQHMSNQNAVLSSQPLEDALATLKLLKEKLTADDDFR